MHCGIAVVFALHVEASRARRGVLWCEGRKLGGEGTLADEELAWVGARRRREGTRRRLSSDELRELETHVNARLWSWWLAWPLAIATGWIAGAIRGDKPAPGALAVVSLAWMTWRTWLALQLRQRLRLDLSARIVIAVPGISIAVPGISAQSGEPEDPEHEFLPLSGAVAIDPGMT